MCTTTLAFLINPLLIHGMSLSGFPCTYLSRACKRNLVYANMRRYCCPCCWSIPWQNIDDARWKASLRNTNGRAVCVSIPFHVSQALLHRFPKKEVRKRPEVSFSYLLDEGSHVQCAEWCLLCRLDNHCVPTAQRGSNFPGKHQQGEVPLEGKSKVKGGKFLHSFNFQAVTSQILKIILNVNPLHCQV